MRKSTERSGSTGNTTRTTLIIYRMSERYAVVARSAAEIAKQEVLAPELDPRIFTALAPELRRGNVWALASADAFGLKLGSVPVMLMASSLGYSQVSYASHRLTYLSDMIAEFNPSVPVHYRVFNVTAVLKPVVLTRPPFLREVFRTNDIESDAAPGAGPWDVVGAARPELAATPEAYLSRVRDWLWSDLPGRGVYASVVPTKVAEHWPSAMAAASPRGSGDWGRVSDSTPLERGEARATLESFRAGSYAILRTSYHPRWHVWVNGRPAAPRWFTPGFLAFEIPRGKSVVRVVFPVDPLRSVLFLISLSTLLSTLALIYLSDSAERLLRVCRLAGLAMTESSRRGA